MTSAHREAIIRVNALLCREFHLSPSTDTIVYHHWYDLNSGSRTNGSGTTKSCPGTAFFGGNSVATARTTFIPEVEIAVNAMATVSIPAGFRLVEVTARNTLNVRAGASTSFPVLKKLQRGVLVQIYEEAGGWCRIHPSESQWVCGRYVH